MTWKKLGKALLFPHPAVMLLLLPAAVVFLVYSMLKWGSESVIACVSYVIAAYTLTAWCFRIPNIIRYAKAFTAENKYAKRWREDTRLRVKVSLYGALLWNTAYGIFQIWLGVYHRTFWFSSLGAYYICLAAMRIFLALHTRKYLPGERIRTELIKYKICGGVLLVMNLALALIVFFMVYWNRTFVHHEITTIAMAAYTFASFTFAIINILKYRKYNSPVFSASKAISLAAACVSMLTLESTMLTTFGNGTMTAIEQKILLGTSGGAISALIIGMAIYMLTRGAKKFNKTKTEVI